jgi:nitrogen fixation NifU-like protein
MELQDLYQDLIIDHGTQPRNCCPLLNANHEAQGFNPLCGDQVHVFLRIQDNQILDATFTGSGCAICMASASLMTEALAGKTISTVCELCVFFKDSLCLQSGNCAPCVAGGCSQLKPDLGKLKALLGVKAFPSRVKCATLPWHTLEAAIQQKSTLVSTEIKD